jgi:hypothetical protein
VIQRGVGGDQTGQLLVRGESGYLQRLFIPKIWGDFDEQAGVRVLAAQTVDNVTQAMSFLQVSQSRGIGRTDVDDKIIPKRLKGAKAVQIICGCFVERRPFGLS